MITRRVRVQLVVFAVITAVMLWYGATRLLGLGEVVDPPYTVDVEVADAGALYPRADVDLLGTKVGRVESITPGPGTGSTIRLALDPDVDIPQDVRVVVGSKSAIGEGFVQIEPRTAGEPYLRDGDTIALEDTVSPPRLEQLLGNLDGLAGSLPKEDLATLLDEGVLALDGLAPSLRRLVRAGTQVSEAGLENVEDLTALLRDARTVLDTQVALGPDTRSWTRDLARVTGTLRDLDPTVVRLYGSGARAATQVSGLLTDNREILPALLADLVAVNEVAATRTQELRKTLTIFPWLLENQINTARFCDDYDIETGDPVEETCHYDDDGNPIVTLHLSQQLPKVPGGPPSASCKRGYERTERYRPDGAPADGTGPVQGPATEPNLFAHCAAEPTDPDTPNVRGSQNVTAPAYTRPGWIGLRGQRASDRPGSGSGSGSSGPPAASAPATLADLLLAPLGGASS